MPTYLKTYNYHPNDTATAIGTTTSTAQQIACPLIYDHIKTCVVCQQAVKNTCTTLTGFSQSPKTDNHNLILYSIFFLFLIILIVVLFKR